MRRPKPTLAAAAVFTEYHNTDDQARAYAKAKLASGTAPLTPESVRHMAGEIARRKQAKAYNDALLAELDREKTNAVAG